MDIRKISLSTLAMAMGLCTFLPQATRAILLQGYLEQKNIAKPVAVSDYNDTSTSSGLTPFKITQPKLTPPPLVSQYSAFMPVANSYPRLFEGNWQCTTIVTSSSMATITVGTTILCDVTFFRAADNRTCAHFYQPGWTEAIAVVLSLSKSEARGDRTNYYQRSDLETTWTARSQDHFMQVNPTSMRGESLVEQYLNGQLVGHYRTRSTLGKR